MGKKTKKPGRSGIKGLDDLLLGLTVRTLKWKKIGNSHYVSGPWSVQKRIGSWMAFSPFEDTAICSLPTKESAFEFAQREYERWVLDALVEVEDSVAPDGGNRVITDGFPKGWFVEDRPGDNTAVLVAPNHSDSGEIAGNAICMRPPLVSTEEWLAVAWRIAREMDPKASHRRMTVRRVSKSPVKIRRLSWERREYEGTGYPLFSTGNVQYVARAGDKAFCVSSLDGNLWRYGDRFDYPNPEAAMEDAQRDFEAPIRALLLNEDIVTEEDRPLLRSTVASSS